VSGVETRLRDPVSGLEGGPRAERTPILIEAGRTRAGLREAYEQRELLLFLVRRDLVVRYVQTVLGLGWAVLVPLLTMVVFTIFFGRLADVDSQGVPYALFSLAAIVPWTYFSTSVNAAANSVVANSSLITKVYFPRVFLPLAPLLAALADLGIAFAVLCAILVAFGHLPELGALALPLLVVVLVAAAAGMGTLLAALGSRYRDVRYATPFLLQLLLFVSPVIYSASVVPTPERYLYALNPMVGVVEGFRAGLLGTSAFPWALVGIGALSSTLLLALGLRVYGRTARYFADLA
jgi:lipopolysaccharide transport system permease protein